jgi:general nucleoside transport system permease protein
VGSRPSSSGEEGKVALPQGHPQLRKILDSVLLVLLGFGVSAVIIELSGYSAPAVFDAILSNAVITPRGISGTLWEATSLTLTGLGATVAFKAGLFNIGVEGQAYLGGFMGFLVGYYLRLPSYVEIPLVIAAAAVGGMAWSLIPGVLKAYRGINEVVTTIMMNYIALYLVQYLQVIYRSPYGNSNITPQVNPTALFTRLSSSGTVDTGIFVAVISVVVVFFMLAYTTLGYSIRLSGINPFAARYAGISPTRMTVLVMLISGGLAGIGGALFTNASAIGHFDWNSIMGVGLNGITVSLVGQLSAVGTFLGALLVGAMVVATPFTGMPPQIVQLITGIIVVAAAIPGIVATIQVARMRWGTRKRGAPEDKGAGK